MIMLYTYVDEDNVRQFRWIQGATVQDARGIRHTIVAGWSSGLTDGEEVTAFVVCEAFDRITGVVDEHGVPTCLACAAGKEFE